MLSKAAFILLILSFAGALDAQPPALARHSWKVYTNVRFQYKICYPADLLVPQGESENSDGQKFVARDGTELLAFGRNNALDQSLKDALQDTASRLMGASGKVTYRVLKPAWFVVSGQNGARIFYAKTLYSHEQFKSFELTYRDSDSSVYKPVVNHLAACFSDLAR